MVTEGFGKPMHKVLKLCKCGGWLDQIVGKKNELFSLLYITREDQQEIIEEEH